MNIGRSLAAIAAGSAVTALVARLFATTDSGIGALIFSLASTVLGAMLGGFLAALIAGTREFPHAAAVGFMMIVLSVVSIRHAGNWRPGWYETTLAGCGPIAAMFGAALRVLSKSR